MAWKPILPVPPSAGTPDLEEIVNAAVLDAHEIYDVQARLLGYVAVTNDGIIPVQYGLNGVGATWEARQWDEGGTFINMAAEWAKRQGLLFDPPPAGGINAAELMTAEYQEPKWAVPAMIPEGVGLLVGRSKSGKSWLALGIAVGVAGGPPAMGNIKCPEGDVLYLALEDEKWRLQSRLRAVLQDAPPPKRLTFYTEWKRFDDGGLEDVERWIVRSSKPILVIVDVWQKVRGRRDRDDGIYEGDYNAIAPIKALCSKHRVAVVLVHHKNKTASNDPLLSVSGTMGVTGSVDTILVLDREPSDNHGTLHIEGRDVDMQDLTLEFDKETGRWIHLGDAKDFKKSQERKEVETALNNFPDGASPKQLAEFTGISGATMRQRLHKMHRAGQIRKLPDGKYARF